MSRLLLWVICVCLSACQPERAAELVPAESSGAAPFDVAAVVAQVELSFRPSASLDATFIGGGPAHDVAVNGAGDVTVGATTMAAIELVLGRPEITRGGHALTERVAPSIDATGAVTIASAAVTERLQNREDGLEQTWTFDARPRGAGDLRVRVPVSGLAYDGATEGGLHFVGVGGGIRYGHATWIDADGRETRVPARHVDGAIEMVVSASIVDASTFPAVLDPIVSPEIESDVPVASGTNSQVQPSVASNGEGWLVVWTDTRSYDVRGARVSAAGVVDIRGIDISESDRAESAPVVASNGTDYFVAWEDASQFDVVGRWVGGDGELVGAPLVIASMLDTQRRPAIASNGTDYLVVFEGRASGVPTFDLYFARVTAAGTLLDPEGRVLCSATGHQSGAAVAAVGGEYFVVWEDRRGATADIYGGGVTSAGALVHGMGVPISDGDAEETTPSIASTAAGYFAVWADTRTGYNDIFGARLDGAGTVIDTEGVLVSGAMYDQLRPRVSSNGSGYLAVWDDYRNGTVFQPYAARVSSSGATLDAAGIALPALGGNPTTGVTVGSDGTDYLVAWTLGTAPYTGVYGSRITSEGLVRDASGMQLASDTNQQREPTVAWNGTSYLVAWTDTRAGMDIYGTRVSPTGEILDPMGIAISTAAGNQLRPEVTGSDSDFYVVWTDTRDSPYTDVGDIFGTRVSGDGDVLEPTGTLIYAGGPSPGVGASSVAWNGTDYLVVISDSGGLGARRVGADGVPIGASFSLGGSGDIRRLPAVASSGLGWLVAFIHTASGFSSVRAVRVGESGTLLDATPIFVGSTELVTRPGVASNGREYMVVWPTLDGVRGARVGVSGSVLGTALELTRGTAVYTDVASDGDGYLAVWSDSEDVRGVHVRGGVPDAATLSITASVHTTENMPRVASGPPGEYLVYYSRTNTTYPSFQTIWSRARGRLVRWGRDAGETCADAAECESGFCADGVCCTTECGGGALDCQACSRVAGAAVDGTCGPATATACTDGSACTTHDTCDAGVCMAGVGACAVGMSCTEAPPAAFECSCGPGTWGLPGSTACTAWTSCDPGTFVVSAGTATTDRTCAPCEAGTFAATVNAASCTRWDTCAAGESIAAEGTATRDRTCASCTAGTFASAPNSVACAAWTTCGSGEFQSRAPTATRDRACASVTECGLEEWEAMAPTATSDRVCRACTVCAVGETLLSPCTSTANATCSATADAGGGTDAAGADGGGGDADIDAGGTADAGPPGAPASCGCRGTRRAGAAWPALVLTIGVTAAARSRRRRGAPPVQNESAPRSRHCPEK